MSPPFGNPLIPTRQLCELRQASVLVLGTSSLGSIDRAASIFDRFLDLGGNFFDTAYIYGQNYKPGCCELTLGTWMRSRGVRGEVVVLGKGGHPPSTTPEAIELELHRTLDRLQTDFLDLYMLHRDSPAIPVSEFVDQMCSFLRAGLIHAYGFSNWTLERIEQARYYAGLKGQPLPSALSNHLSLAVMEKPIYPGCISVCDRASRCHLEADRYTLIPWSSQGRGVFTSVHNAEEFKRSDLAHCWLSDGNVERLRRAQQLAEGRHVIPVNIALAWVLQQPFPTFPIIGPRSVSELESSLRALDVSLSIEEMAWLNLEDRAITATRSNEPVDCAISNSSRVPTGS
jgi:aryl-alcohol dehydrogenase-like predicted oxidoreductase